MLIAMVGMRHRGTEDLVKTLRNGHPLELRREPNNEHDPYAVAVYAGTQQLGYLSRKQNEPVAAGLDRGVKYEAKLHRSAPERWPLIELWERTNEQT